MRVRPRSRLRLLAADTVAACGGVQVAESRRVSGAGRPVIGEGRVGAGFDRSECECCCGCV